jgi:hypothetical protein
MVLLRAPLKVRIGSARMTVGYLWRLWSAALAGAALGWLVKLSLPPVHPVVLAAAVLIPYGLMYFGATFALGIPEASAAVRRVLRR